MPSALHTVSKSVSYTLPSVVYPLSVLFQVLNGWRDAPVTCVTTSTTVTVTTTTLTASTVTTTTSTLTSMPTMRRMPFESEPPTIHKVGGNT